MGGLKNEYSVILLSAGVGSRFRKSIRKPKCLLNINNKSLIHRIIKQLIKLGINDINIVVGFQKTKIQKHLRQFKKIKINYIFNKYYKNYGSGYSWFEALKQVDIKKKCILLHTDIIFDPTYLSDIIFNKHENIIGQTSYNKNGLNDLSLVLESKKNHQIKKINYRKNIKDSTKEVICINKFSSSTTINFFLFMKNYFKKANNKDKTWELIVNDFIINKKIRVFHQGVSNKKWYNINSQIDYKKAKEAFYKG